MWFRRIFHPADQENSTRPRPKSVPGEASPFLDFQAIRQLDRLQIRGSRDLRGERMGLRSSHRRKPAMEFREFRMYVPGDDIRFVDWRASGRHDKLFVRQGELPKDVIVYLLIDCTASMLWGTMPKNNAQLSVASALGYLALAHGDRLAALAYGGKVHPHQEFGPVSGKSNISVFIRYLKELEYGGQGNLIEAVSRLTKRVSRGGVLFILSDLLERNDLGAVLDKVPAPYWWVNVLHMMNPQEITPDWRGYFELADIETNTKANFDLTPDAIKTYTQRVVDWQSRLELTCIEQHALYTVVDTDDDLGHAIIPQLRALKVLVDL